MKSIFFQCCRLVTGLRSESARAFASPSELMTTIQFKTPIIREVTSGYTDTTELTAFTKQAADNQANPSTSIS
jgi:hypothetical protein